MYLRPATFLKKGFWQRCFPVDFAKYLRDTFFTEHLHWLVLIKAPPKNNIKKTCFLPSRHQAFTQSSQYQNWKAKKYPILTVIEHGLNYQCQSPKLGSQNFLPPLILNKFHKIEIGYWLPIGINVRRSWMRTHIHNHFTMFSC